MTQNTMILEHLKKGKSITAKDAMMKFGCYRLASRISELKDMGHDIVTDWVSSKNRYGETVRYASYRLRVKK